MQLDVCYASTEHTLHDVGTVQAVHAVRPHDSLLLFKYTAILPAVRLIQAVGNLGSK